MHIDGLGSTDEEERTRDDARRCQVLGAIDCPEARCRYAGASLVVEDAPPFTPSNSLLRASD
jgi:hypothetical protein